MTDDGYLQNKIRNLKEELSQLEQTHIDLKHDCDHLQKKMDSNSDRLKRLDDVEKMTKEFEQNMFQAIERKFKKTEEELFADVNNSLKSQHKKETAKWDKIHFMQISAIDNNAFVLGSTIENVKTWLITFNRILLDKNIITKDAFRKISRETENFTDVEKYTYLHKNQFSYSVMKYDAVIYTDEMYQNDKKKMD